MYDSFLYGNGLTLAIKYLISDIIADNEYAKYIDITYFVNDFICMQSHKKIYREYMKTFNKNTSKYEAHHEKTKEILRKYSDDIKDLGFEVWISTKVFLTDEISNEERVDIINIVYPLYSFWYNFVLEKILQNSEVQAKLKSIANKISSKIRDKILTLNFDTILDKWLDPQHLHGKIPIPFKHFMQLVLHFSDDGNEFQWNYLLGGNGYEKYDRTKIMNSRKPNNDFYDWEFLLDNSNNINYGHMLIYGVSFSRSYIFSDEFLKAYPNYKNDYLIISIDGHILLRLSELYKSSRIQKITLAYYSERDLSHYKYLINMTEFKSIVDYKHTSEIFDFT